MQVGWRRYKWKDVCPVCAHGGKRGHGSGCCYLGEIEAPELVLCLRVEAGSFSSAKDGMGWLHRFKEINKPKEPYSWKIAKQEAEDFTLDFPAILLRWAKDTKLSMVKDLGDALGVSREALLRLGTVWSVKHNAWAFPMMNAKGDVIGIRMRAMDASKWAITGSRNGLFIPLDNYRSDILLVCEGPTDTAAVIDMGFAVVGRASCSTCIDEIKEYGNLFETIVVISDGDSPGKVGAAKLALALGRKTKIVIPPCKDVRQWRKQGCTSDILKSVIQNSHPPTVDSLKTLIQRHQELIAQKTAASMEALRAAGS